MSRQRTRRNLRPALWVGISLIGFALALGLQSAAVAFLASLALLGALLSVARFPRIRD
jgi:hypothetical protein